MDEYFGGSEILKEQSQTIASWFSDHNGAYYVCALSAVLCAVYLLALLYLVILRAIIYRRHEPSQISPKYSAAIMILVFFICANIAVTVAIEDSQTTYIMAIGMWMNTIITFLLGFEYIYEISQGLIVHYRPEERVPWIYAPVLNLMHMLAMSVLFTNVVDQVINSTVFFFSLAHMQFMIIATVRLLLTIAVMHRDEIDLLDDGRPLIIEDITQ